MRLTAETLGSFYPGQDLLKLDEINSSGKQVSEIDDISHLKNLHKLNLSDNQFSSSNALDGLARNEELSFLNLSKNQLNSAEFICNLKKLTVLNLSRNQLTDMPKELRNLRRLKALILNDNLISDIHHLQYLTQLNTIVLSHNPIKQIGGSFGKLTKLTKISMSGCQLSLPNEDADCFNTCKESLKELRLNNNKITRLPKQFESLHALEILDLGGNGIKTIEQLKVLADLPNLVNLNLKANPVCNSPDYKDTVKSMFPKLRVLDGERFDEKFIKRKEKLNRKRKAAAAEDSDQQILKKQMK